MRPTSLGSREEGCQRGSVELRERVVSLLDGAVVRDLLRGGPGCRHDCGGLQCRGLLVGDDELRLRSRARNRFLLLPAYHRGRVPIDVLRRQLRCEALLGGSLQLRQLRKSPVAAEGSAPRRSPGRTPEAIQLAVEREQQGMPYMIVWCMEDLVITRRKRMRRMPH